MVKITALAENVSKRPELGSEHGLSLYIEADGKKLLFDTGAGRLFADNAEKLGVDLGGVELAVISHGHWDHGGGIRTFLERNDHAPVYLSRLAFGSFYDAEDGKFIGLDPALRDEPRLILTGDETELTPHMHLFTCNGRRRADPFGSFGLSVRREGRLQPDDFLHEQYLLIEDEGKRTVVSGCSHKGILNIVEWLQPDVLIGGFHFMKTEPGPELDRYAAALESSGARFYTCHCTGKKQYEAMEPEMSRLAYLSTGDSITI